MSGPDDGNDLAVYLLRAQDAAGFGGFFPDEPSK